jgi:hypothetical protein
VTAPKEWGPRTRDPGFDASPQDLRDAPRDTAPDPTDEATAPRSAPFPQSRLFEKRLPPGFHTPASLQPRSLADIAGINNAPVYRGRKTDTRDPATGQLGSLSGIPGGTFQQVVAKSKGSPPPKYPTNTVMK